MQSHCGRPSVFFQRLRPEGNVTKVDPRSGVIDGEPELVHGLQSFRDVVEDVVGVVHDLEVGLRILANVALERAVVKPIQVLKNGSKIFKLNTQTFN